MVKEMCELENYEYVQKGLNEPRDFLFHSIPTSFSPMFTICISRWTG